MQKLLLIILIVLGLSITGKPQYITNVLEYNPAPGQLINEAPWGTPSAAQSIIGGIDGHLSLGAWGGYVVFEFASAVENNPDNPYGIDFTIFGNPMPDWSEPGIVWVMKDENNNGLPDDLWYQLAGSDYHFSNTIRNYEVTYTNPDQDSAVDVPWNDNLGNSGYILANSIHTQPYYPLADSFPNISTTSYQLNGTRIQPEVDSTSFMVKVLQRGFGYADNQLKRTEPWTTPDNPYTTEIENSGGDGFDISWAVDELGNSVVLDEIHFIKVQNGMLADGSWLGEISTEISGAVDVSPNTNISGVNQMVVIRDLPPIIREEYIELEAMAFENGLLLSSENIVWSTTSTGASIDEENVLHLTQSGTIEITATMESNPEISAMATATVELSNSINSFNLKDRLQLYPNPAKEYFIIEDNGLLEIRNQLGQIIIKEHTNKNDRINISHLTNGIYLVSLNGRTVKLIKQ
ncbi:MAG: hypothetical protein C0599_11090 [Salinivirgaceae bacterium]|nr:MAG: hypothetical protein C0599_11090 [Salinivirgaceae bacterium]